MKKFKKWLIDNFLPMWAKQTILEENKRLMEENELLKQKIREQQCFINGMERGQKAVRRIYITGGAKAE